MSTLLSSLETQSRRHLNEVTASFWSSAELIDIANKGIKDLWGAIIDLYQEHYLTIDTTNVAIAANAEVLSGVPTDVFRVHLIEPKTTSITGSYRNIQFVPRDYNSADFKAARQLGSCDPSQANVIFFALSGAGAPVGAPTVLIAPALSIAIPAGEIRLAYNPTVADKIASDANPIPGESDNALIAWLTAYATEKQNILTRLTPRQTQEPDVVEDFFRSF